DLLGMQISVVRGRPEEGQATALQDRHAIGVELEFLEVLRREGHRSTLVAQRGHGLPQPAPLTRIERRRRLVEEQDARNAEARKRDVQALPVPDGERVRGTIGGDVEARKEPRRNTAVIGLAFEAGEELEILTRSQ